MLGGYHDLIVSNLIFFSVFILGYFVYRYCNDKPPTLKNPFKYDTIIKELKANKYFHQVSPIKKLKFPFIFDQPPKYQIIGNYDVFQFVITLDECQTVLKISANIWFNRIEGFESEITWVPINLAYSSYTHIGKHLVSQLKEILELGTEMKPRYTLRIPLQNSQKFFHENVTMM